MIVKLYTLFKSSPVIVYVRFTVTLLVIRLEATNVPFLYNVAFLTPVVASVAFTVNPIVTPVAGLAFDRLFVFPLLNVGAVVSRTMNHAELFADWPPNASAAETFRKYVPSAVIFVVKFVSNVVNEPPLK